jgi:GxxExxY protein
MPKQKNDPFGITISMEQEEITYQIIGAAYQVYNTLGFGFLGSVYKKAMIIELDKKVLPIEEEKQMKVYYEGKIVGDFFIDLLVNGEIVLELKSIQSLKKEHEAQLVNYLNGLQKDLGLLINFGPSGTEVRRKYRKYEVIT